VKLSDTREGKTLREILVYLKGDVGSIEIHSGCKECEPTLIGTQFTVTLFGTSGMTSRLIECIKEKQPSTMRFLWSESVKTNKIFGRMPVHYDDDSTNQRNVYE
jgi:hypothetical protein